MGYIGELLGAIPRSPLAALITVATVMFANLYSTILGGGFVDKISGLLDLLPKMEACGMASEQNEVKEVISRLVRRCGAVSKFLDDFIGIVAGPLKVTGFLWLYWFFWLISNVVSIPQSASTPLLGADCFSLPAISLIAITLLGLLTDTFLVKLFWSGYKVLSKFINWLNGKGARLSSLRERK